MTSDTGHHEQARSIATNLATGLLGAGLVYYGRRTQSGIISALTTTIGASLITKAVSSAVLASLSPARG